MENFLFGAFFVLILSPLMDTFAELIASAFELLQFKMASLKAKYQKQITDMQLENESEAIAIGFQMEEDEE